MIRVGFIGGVSKEWMGGLNYYNNLLYAIGNIKQNEVKAIVFLGKKTDASISDMFSKNAEVIKNSAFDRKSFKWFLIKIEQRVFKTNHILEFILKKAGIDILSHSLVAGLKSVKTFNWIADFQHVYLPHMFSESEICYRNCHFKQLIECSDLIILSSYDALDDYNKFLPGYESKAAVLQFVSQPDRSYFLLSDKNKKALFDKYDIEDEYFFIPNQFWKHKNHLLVFKAVKEIIERGGSVRVICTGHLSDYRNEEYISDLIDFVRVHRLQNYIKLLGLVPYEDVFSLIKFSKAVLNPSLFEGWSSTVEECKSVGKNMILSDLKVHKEQYPEAVFFDRNSVESLALVLMSYQEPDTNDFLKNSLSERTERFGLTYINLCKAVVS